MKKRPQPREGNADARPPLFIALLRGINVSGRNMVAMPALRSLCEDLGWCDVRTYIQSGNLVFRAAVRSSAPAAAKLEAELERALERLGVAVPVIVRAATSWPEYTEGNPFAGESGREPNRVMLALSKAPPRPGAIEGLRERATSGERLVQSGDAIWVHYPSGAGRSKLSPALFDRLVGSPVTARNWRTVLKLDEMMRGAV